MPSTSEARSAPKARALIVPVTPFQQNCTIIVCEATQRAVVIDPGGDLDRVAEGLAQTSAQIDRVWLTHGHLDHAGGAAEFAERHKVPIEGPHIADKFLLDSLAATGSQWGLEGMRNVTPDRWLDEGDTVTLGGLSFEVLHCPGHSPGSVVYFSRAMQFAHVGDVLFNGSIGRTDLPGGNHAQLIASITNKLLPLGDDVGFICGHGPGSTIGHERKTNPFVLGSA